MKTIALICPALTGHHETYLRIFSRTLLQAGHRVVAFTPQPDRLHEWAFGAAPEHAKDLVVHDLAYAREPRGPGLLSVFRDKLAWFRFTAKLVRESGVKPDLVFHTFLDDCLTPGLAPALADALMPYPWTGLFFHPWYLRQNLSYSRFRRGFLGTHAALRARRCPAVAVLDEGIAAPLRDRLGGKPVIVFPDFADGSPPDRDFGPIADIRARANGRTIIGLVGALARRKGMITLMEAASHLQQDEVFFVFAGELALGTFLPDEQRRIREWLQSPPSNCFVYLERISSEAKFNAVVEACDILFAAYHHFMSSSNLLTKAALFEKPIIVSDGYCMGERVRAYGLGRTIAENDVEACVAAIRQLRGQLAQDPGFSAARFAEYRDRHSVDRLSTAFAELLSAADRS